MVDTAILRELGDQPVLHQVLDCMVDTASVNNRVILIKNMIITRKIEVFICEDDKDLRKSYYDKVYEMRDVAVKVANMCVSHLFALDNTMPYLSEEDKDKITFLGTKGRKATKQNAPYVVASEAFKGRVSMSMVSSVLQDVQKMYQDDRKKGMWNKSLRSYKSDIPIPFKADMFTNLRFADYITKEEKSYNGCFFTLTGLPFQMKFGRDRSNNRSIVENVIKEEYKMCTSSLKCEKNKIFLLLSVDIPKKEVELKEGKIMYAFLSVFHPIICTTKIECKDRFIDDSRKSLSDIKNLKVFDIGTKEEFNYRRRQIQEAVKRCQQDNKYSVGGKGRKRKTQALDRYHEKEKNYVDTKLHLYSRMLVDLAIKHKCSTIYLLKQKKREDKAKEDNKKGEPFVLRNWSYYGLKEKIKYKAEMVGITLKQDKEKGEEAEEYSFE